MRSAGEIMSELEDIQRDLANRQQRYETAAEEWTNKQREREKEWAKAYLGARDTTGHVTDRKAEAIMASSHIGVEEEARYRALKGALDVLESRAKINQSLLKWFGYEHPAIPGGDGEGDDGMPSDTDDEGGEIWWET